MAYELPLTWQSPATSPFLSMLGLESSTAPSQIAYGLDEHTGYPGRDSSAAMALGGETVAGPPTPPMDGLPLREGLDPDPRLSTAILRNAKNKRRVQNREAQRRFRTRKDQLQKTLQQKTDDLRTEYLALQDQHAKTTTEVSRLLKENDALRSEIKGHRQQERLMMTVLQMHLRGSQSPSPPKPGEDAAIFDVRSCWRDLIDDPSPQDSG